MEDFFSQEIGYEPQIDFSIKNDTKIVIKNGSPNMIKEIEAIRQWIIKFCMTEKDAYPIYQGTGFGVRFKKLFGCKRLGFGYEEAEIERDFREGLPLNPAISRVSNFELSKKGKVLNISVEVELFSGSLLTVDIEKAYTLSANLGDGNDFSG